MNIINDAGVLAFGTRLSRVLEMLRNDGNSFYIKSGVNFETKWFPVVYVLSKATRLTVTELAFQIGTSHPATISLLKELERKDLISSSKDTSDERKRNIELSENGKVMVKSLKPYWLIMEKILTQLTITESTLYQNILDLEIKLTEKSFAERLINEKLAPIHQDTKIEVNIVQSQVEISIAKAIFTDLDLDISKASDVNLEEKIYLLATFNGLPCGAAYLTSNKNKLHIHSIAVLRHYQDRGIGLALMNKIIARFEKVKEIHVVVKPNHVKFYMNYGFTILNGKENELGRSHLVFVEN